MKLRKSGDNLGLAVLSWVHLLLLAGALYLLESLVYETRTPQSLLADALWLAIPIVLSWVAIRALGSLVAYLAVGVAVCAGMAWLSHAFLTAALSVSLFAIRGYARVKKGRANQLMREMPGAAGAQMPRDTWEIPTFLDRPSPGHWAWFVACYAACIYTKKVALLPWEFFLLFVDVFVCFVFSYLDHMWRFIRENRKLANLPAHSIQKVGGIVLFASAMALFVLVLPSALYGKEPLVDFRPRMRPVPAARHVETESPQLPDNFDGADLSAIAGEPVHLPAWLEAAAQIFLYLTVLAAAVGILAVLWRVCRNALSYFAQGEEDEIYFLGVEEKSYLGRNGRGRRRGRAQERAIDKKIRKLYKKKIRGALKVKPGGWETPTELENKAGLANEMQESNLHDLYERARYAPQGCGDLARWNIVQNSR